MRGPGPAPRTPASAWSASRRDASDTYDWKTSTDVKSGLAQSVDFDQYATLLGQAAPRA